MLHGVETIELHALSLYVVFGGALFLSLSMCCLCVCHTIWVSAMTTFELLHCMSTTMHRRGSTGSKGHNQPITCTYATYTLYGSLVSLLYPSYFATKVS